MTKFVGAGLSLLLDGADSPGFAISPVRVSRFVATIRQVEGEQRRRNPGAPVAADSPTANASENKAVELPVGDSYGQNVAR